MGVAWLLAMSLVILLSGTAALGEEGERKPKAGMFLIGFGLIGTWIAALMIYTMLG